MTIRQKKKDKKRTGEDKQKEGKGISGFCSPPRPSKFFQAYPDCILENNDAKGESTKKESDQPGNFSEGFGN